MTLRPDRRAASAICRAPRRWRQGLLQDDVLAARQGAAGDLRVQVVRQHDVDDVHVVPREDLVVVRGPPRDAPRLGLLPRVFLGRAHHPGDADIGLGPPAQHVVLAPNPGADDRDAVRGHPGSLGSRAGGLGRARPIAPCTALADHTALTRCPIHLPVGRRGRGASPTAPRRIVVRMLAARGLPSRCLADPRTGPGTALAISAVVPRRCAGAGRSTEGDPPAGRGRRA